MCSDLQSASQGCAFFSATGILFMSWVGIMLMKQPFFIAGIEDVESAKGSAFGAAGLFFFTFCGSIFYMINHDRKIDLYNIGNNSRRSPSRGEYGQVPLSDTAMDFNMPTVGPPASSPVVQRNISFT